MSSLANEFCKIPNTDALILRCVSYFITSGFVKKWQSSQIQEQFASSVFGGIYAGLVPFGLLTACGSSQEFFVICERCRRWRQSSQITVWASAAGGKARKHYMGERCWWQSSQITVWASAAGGEEI